MGILRDPRRPKDAQVSRPRESNGGIATTPITSPQPPPASLQPDRLTLVWRSRWWVVLAAIAGVAAAVGVSRLMSPVYESSALVRVVTPPATADSPSIVASNDLASQYSELVKSAPILAAAAAELEIPQSTLRDSVSAGTVAGQNLISVAAQAGVPDESARRANALAATFSQYIDDVNSSQAERYAQSVEDQLRPIDHEIRRARKDVDDATRKAQRADPEQAPAAASALAAKQGALTSLLAQRQTIAASFAQGEAAAQPVVDVWAEAGPGQKIQPRPVLYAVVAGLVAALVAAQMAVVIKSRSKGE